MTIAGCEPPEEAKEEAPDEEEIEEVEEPEAPNPAKDQRDNTLIYGDGLTSGVFNPALYATVYDMYIVDLVFDQLLAVDEEGELITDDRSLATEVEVDEEGTTFTYYLEEGVKFHDGEELTAEDVAFTWEVHAHPHYDGPNAFIVNNIEGVAEFREGEADEVAGINVIDDYTVEVETIEPLATQKHDMNVHVMPKHYYKWDYDNPEDYQDHFQALNQEPIGTGPFEFDEYLPEQRVELEANEDYFLGTPELDTFIYDEYDSLDALIPALETGAIDVTNYQTDLDTYEMVQDIEHAEHYGHLNNGYSYIGIHHDHPILGEQKVRQALMYGFNRNAWIESFFGDLGQPANTPLSPASWAYPGDEAFEDYEYDLDKANELLDEAGYDEWDEDGEWRLDEDGEPIEIEYLTYSEADWSVQIPEIAQDDWADLGIKLDIEMSEFVTVQERIMAEQDFDMYNMAWSLTADPDPYQTFSIDNSNPGERNSGQYHNERAEELMEEGRRTFDQEERKEIYEELFTLFNKDLPYLFVYFRDESFGINNRVENFQPTEFQYWTWNIHEVSVDY